MDKLTLFIIDQVASRFLFVVIIARVNPWQWRICRTCGGFHWVYQTQRYADELLCFAIHQWMMSGLDQSEHDCKFCANAPIVVMVTQLRRAVAIRWWCHHWHEGQHTWNAETKAPRRGSACQCWQESTRTNFIKTDFQGKVFLKRSCLIGASWEREALSKFPSFRLLRWSGLVRLLRGRCMPDRISKGCFIIYG